MESHTLEGLRLLELITVEAKMAGKAEALAAGISNHTIVAIAIARDLLRKYSSNAFIAGMTDAIRFAYPECVRQIDLTFADLEGWALYLPSEAEFAQSGVVEGFVFDLLKRCNAETLTAVWGRMIYPYIQTIKKR